MNGPVICGIEDAFGSGVADVACELAKHYEAPLLFAHVLDGAGDPEPAARMLREAAPDAGELVIEKGQHPADRLVQLARERGALFLVVGNHGPRSSLLGSISADVSRQAPCPVIVVPAAAEPAGSPTGSDELEVDGGILRFQVGSVVGEIV